MNDMQIQELLRQRADALARLRLLPYDGAKTEAQRAGMYYRAAGAEEKLWFDLFPGEHEFCLRRLHEFMGCL